MTERDPLLKQNGRQFGGPPRSQELSLDAMQEKAIEFNTAVGQLSRMAKEIGTSKDTEEFRKQLRIQREDCANMARTILTQMKKITYQRNEKAKHDKLVLQINDIFQTCQRISQESIQKEQTSPLATRPKPKIQAPDENWQPYVSEQERANKEMERAQNQLRYQSQQVNNAILDERDTEIKYLENELQGLNEMFVDIAHLIKEQGEDISTIESNTESAVAHTDEGVKQLQKASEYQKSYRTKLCCLLLIITIVAGGIAIFAGVYCGAMKKC